MKFGISLLWAHPATWLDVAEASDGLGFDSVWVSDHLVLAVDRGSEYPGEQLGAASNTIRRGGGPRGETFPLFDCPAFMAALAARTKRIRIGTFVYLLGLRHPLITARAFATVDIISGGRVELGVGAGWLESEWRAVGMDWAGRGRALEEAIEVNRRLWTEPTVEHSGETWAFDAVWFEPKPVQPQGPPIIIGGESPAALRRAARLGDGWVGMEHTPETLSPVLNRLRRHCEENNRPYESLSISVAGAISDPGEIAAWERLGVDRLIMTPWKRSSESIASITTFADRFGVSAAV